MHYFFVTGSSKGLGLSLVHEILKRTDNFVFGFSRTNPLIHPNFIHTELDLADICSLENFYFSDLNDIDSVTLINNAGLIGDIKPVGQKSNAIISKTIRVNATAVFILMNQFINQFQNLKAKKTIINISSGAGRHTVNSWAEYCASKAALDMFSIVTAEEQKKFKNPIKIFSIAPGVVDTSMQKEIRSVKAEDFDQLEYFQNLKTEHKLAKPEKVAEQFISMLQNAEQYTEVILDLRNL